MSVTLSRWQTIRIGILAATCGSLVLVLGKIILLPSSGQPKLTAYEFPSQVPLSEWQQIESQPLPPAQDAEILASRTYLYSQNNLNLDVEMRYLLTKHGDVKMLMQKHKRIERNPGKLKIRNQKGIGEYGIWETPDRTYLSACINPGGGSSVTSETFRKNRNTHDLSISRLLPWLLGQTELRDWRCLWAVISLPVDATKSPEDVYPILETAWVSWYRWWQPQFPKP